MDVSVSRDREYRPVRVSITTLEGEVLDLFILRHWRDDPVDPAEDTEGHGSSAADELLLHRIRCAAEVIPC